MRGDYYRCRKHRKNEEKKKDIQKIINYLIFQVIYRYFAEKDGKKKMTAADSNR